jgi:hypothetical protein
LNSIPTTSHRKAQPLLHNTQNFTGPVNLDVEVYDVDHYIVFVNALDNSFTSSIIVEWTAVDYTIKTAQSEFNVIDSL